MDIPMKALRLSLDVLAYDTAKQQWQRFGNRASIADAALTHLEDVQSRMCKEMDVLWSQSKLRWVGRYALNVAHVTLEIDTAAVSPTGICTPQTLGLQRDFNMTPSTTLEDFGASITHGLRLIIPKWLYEVGRKVYGPTASRQRIQ